MARGHDVIGSVDTFRESSGFFEGVKNVYETLTQGNVFQNVFDFGRKVLGDVAGFFSGEKFSWMGEFMEKGFKNISVLIQSLGSSIERITQGSKFEVVANILKSLGFMGSVELAKKLFQNVEFSEIIDAYKLYKQGKIDKLFMLIWENIENLDQEEIYTIIESLDPILIKNSPEYTLLRKNRFFKEATEAMGLPLGSLRYRFIQAYYETKKEGGDMNQVLSKVWRVFDTIPEDSQNAAIDAVKVNLGNRVPLYKEIQEKKIIDDVLNREEMKEAKISESMLFNMGIDAYFRSAGRTLREDESPHLSALSRTAIERFIPEEQHSLIDRFRGALAQLDVELQKKGLRIANIDTILDDTMTGIAMDIAKKKATGALSMFMRSSPDESEEDSDIIAAIRRFTEELIIQKI